MRLWKYCFKQFSFSSFSFFDRFQLFLSEEFWTSLEELKFTFFIVFFFCFHNVSLNIQPFLQIFLGNRWFSLKFNFPFSSFLSQDSDNNFGNFSVSSQISTKLSSPDQITTSTIHQDVNTTPLGFTIAINSSRNVTCHHRSNRQLRNMIVVRVPASPHQQEEGSSNCLENTTVAYTSKQVVRKVFLLACSTSFASCSIPARRSSATFRLYSCTSATKPAGARVLSSEMGIKVAVEMAKKRSKPTLATERCGM